MRKKNILAAVLLGLFFLNISLAHSQGLIPPPRGGEGDYQLIDFVILAINISKWILGIVGSLSLIMFIYGGFTFLISAGASDKISDAKKIIVAAVVGLVIVFTSFLIIQFVMGSMGLTWSGTMNAPTQSK